MTKRTHFSTAMRIAAVFMTFLWMEPSAATVKLTEPHYVVEAKVGPEGLMLMGGRFAIPQLRVYDRGGRQVLDTGSELDLDTFADVLLSTLLGSRPTGSELTLRDELRLLVTADGRPLGSPLPPADFTVVKYWADWCLPCHAQTRLLQEVLASQTSVSVALVHAEVAPEEVLGSGSHGDSPAQGSRRRTIPPADLPPDVQRRLLDPSMSETRRPDLAGSEGSSADQEPEGEPR